MRGLRNKWSKFDDLLDQVLGLGARDQHVGSDAEGQSVEFAFAGDVLDWLAFATALEKTGIADRRATGEVIASVRQEPGRFCQSGEGAESLHRVARDQDAARRAIALLLCRATRAASSGRLVVAPSIAQPESAR